MSSIYSFLQKRKMHENQHGFVMVFTAYILSFLMLALGSDVFYNINSAAKGVGEDTKEEANKLYIQETPDILYVQRTSQTPKSSLINPYGLTDNTDQPAKEKESGNTSINGDTIWLFGNAMDGEEFDNLMEKIGSNASIISILKNSDSKEKKDEIDVGSINAKEKVDKEKEASEKVAKKTKKTVNKESEEASSTDIMNVTKEDVKMLERIVEAEATGEDMKGKILVVNVILNRMESNEFPDTVKGVIFQKVNGDYQFSPVSDERYWSVNVTKETKVAVQRALEGEDYSKGALYFVAKKRTKSGSAKWFDNNLKWLFKHGGHDFYKNK